MEMETQNTSAVFDPLAWSAPQTVKSEPAASTSHQSPPCQSLSHEEELARAKAVAYELIRIGANIADDYQDYVRLGFALANGLGSDGRDLYHLLCSNSTKYRTNDCERKWRECLRKADGRTSIATFYHMARQAGVDISALARKQKSNHHYYSL